MKIQKLFIICPLLIFNIITLNLQTSNADPLDNWHWRNPLPHLDHLNAVTYGNNMFVAVGGYGLIMTSPDGEEWTVRSSANSKDFLGVTFGGGLFVAVGSYGLTAISTDGKEWTLADSGAYLYGVAYGNGTFVGVGPSMIVTSTDGVTWTQRPIYIGGASQGGYSVAFGNGLFVVGSYGNQIFVSPDGVNWTRIIAADPGETSTFYTVTYANGTFIAAGDVIKTSPDGVTWTTRNINTTDRIEGIAYGNGGFVAVESWMTIYTSSDGLSWNSKNMIDTFAWNLCDVAWGNNTYVAVGRYCSIYTSPDGETWTSRSSQSDFFYLYGVAYGNDTFIAVGPGPIAFISHYGVTWEKLDLWKVTPYWLYAVTYGNGIFVAVGQSGVIWTTLDGKTWIQRDNGDFSFTWADYGFHAVTYDNGMFIAVGDEGCIVTSFDGITWTKRDSGVVENLYSITYGAGKFVAVGTNGIVLTSSDGIIWEAFTLGRGGELLGYNFGSVTYGNGIFIIPSPGDWHTLFKSSDGESWAEVETGMPLDFYRVLYVNGVFIAFTQREFYEELVTLYTSSDGQTWTTRNPQISNYLNWITYGNGTLVGVGYLDIIVQTDSFLPGPFFPAIELNVPAIDFGTINEGTTSEVKTLTISNGNLGDLVISQIEKTGLDPDQFILMKDNCSQQVIEPGKRCKVQVVFSPMPPGYREANLKISSNDPETPILNISLTGTTEVISTPSVVLQSPNIDQIFDSCSLITRHQQTFTWTANGTFTGYSILFSPSDFAAPIVRANIRAPKNSWTPPIKLWKRIVTQSYNNGNVRDIYWKVIGTTPNRTTIESEVRSFRIGNPQAVTINTPSEGAILSSSKPPTFNFNSNCNITTIRLEFSPLSDFSDPTRIKGFVYKIRDPIGTPVANWTLAPRSWNRVKTLIGTGMGYFRIKALDGISRETISEVKSFTIQ